MHLHARPARRHRPPALTTLALLAVLALASCTHANATDQPPIGVLTTTTTSPASRYQPSPAGPPATDAHGQWVPEPDPPTSISHSTGGGR
jgi:hypothetical protein